MISFDKVGAMLDDIADDLPECFYKELNGGIILSPAFKLHPQSKRGDDLFIMGEYHYDPYGLGRYILMYYGSFSKVYPHLRPSRLKEELKRILIHEITHHLESLGGERGLEIKDAQQLERYKRGLLHYRQE